MVVVVVALSIESLVAVFQLVHSDPSRLPQAASVAVAAAFLLAAWGCFVKLNTSAEELEPEAMEEDQARGRSHRVGIGELSRPNVKGDDGYPEQLLFGITS